MEKIYRNYKFEVTKKRLNYWYEVATTRHKKSWSAKV